MIPVLCVLPTHAEMWTAYREQKYNNLEGHEGPILTVVSLEEGPPRAEGKPGVSTHATFLDQSSAGMSWISSDGDVITAGVEARGASDLLSEPG